MVVSQETKKSSGGGPTITKTGDIDCSFDKGTITLGESFDFTASYGGSCYNSEFTGSGVSSSNCQSAYTVIPRAIGTQNYKYSVTNGSNGTASCEADITVNAPSGQYAIVTNEGTSIPSGTTTIYCMEPWGNKNLHCWGGSITIGETTYANPQSYETVYNNCVAGSTVTAVTTTNGVQCAIYNW